MPWLGRRYANFSSRNSTNWISLDQSFGIGLSISGLSTGVLCLNAGWTTRQEIWQLYTCFPPLCCMIRCVKFKLRAGPNDSDTMSGQQHMMTQSTDVGGVLKLNLLFTSRDCMGLSEPIFIEPNNSNKNTLYDSWLCTVSCKHQSEIRLRLFAILVHWWLFRDWTPFSWRGLDDMSIELSYSQTPKMMSPFV